MAEVDIEKNNERLQLLKELREIIGFSPKIDGLTSALSKCIVIDIIEFDRQLAQRDRDYDHQKAEWMGMKCSSRQYVKRRFGDRAVEIVEILIKS